MLKLNSHKLGAKALGLFATVLFVSSCKTSPATNQVNALDLLDGRSSFYMKLPSSVDQKMISKIVQSSFDGISENDAMMVAGRLDTVYVGMNKTKKSTEYQIATACNIPKIAVNKIFTRKNGFQADKLTLDLPSSKSVSYTVYSGSSIRASFPSEQIALLGRSVQDMVVTYHCIANQMNAVQDSPLDYNVYEWLSSGENEIRFFATRPQSFLTILTGANLNFKLLFVRGSMVTDPKHDNQYLMNLEFEFKNPAFVSMAKSAITLAFGLTDSSIVQETPTNVKVNRIKISKDQLYKLFVL